MTELSFSLPEKGEARSASDAKIKEGLSKTKEAVNGNLDHTNLSGSAEITRAQLATEAKPLKWYTPKVIATEETRENVAFGTLTTADEIASVVLAENGLIRIGYRAVIKSSVGGAGRLALFLGSNQIKGVGGAVVEQATETSFKLAHTAASEAAFAQTTWTEDATTGQIAVASELDVFAAAGTYTVSARYKATSGSVTAKNRKLWVATLG